MTGDPVISRLNFYQRHAKKSKEPVFWQLREESVAGVTFDNRQAIISNLKPGDDLTLEREPENCFDSNAIAVKTSHGLNIGFLNRDIAKDLAPIMDGKKQIIHAKVSAILGGVPDQPVRGVRIRFEGPPRIIPFPAFEEIEQND